MPRPWPILCYRYATAGPARHRARHALVNFLPAVRMHSRFGVVSSEQCTNCRLHLLLQYLIDLLLQLSPHRFQCLVYLLLQLLSHRL